MRLSRLWQLKKKRQLSAIGLLIGLLLTTVGCTSFLFTLLYLVKGPDTPAEFKGFKKHKVAVVCRAVTTLDYDSDGIPRDIAHKVGDDLSKKVKKVEIVESAKIDRSLNKRMSIKDFREIGQEFDSDYVLGIELEHFQISSPSSPGNYQGRARYIIKVFDMNDGGKQVFTKNSPDIIYPPNSVIDSAARSAAEFRREFVEYVAYHIGKSFYPHNPRDFVAEDAKAGL